MGIAIIHPLVEHQRYTPAAGLLQMIGPDSVKIPLSPIAMYAAMKANGVTRAEMNNFATYLERLPDSESPRGTMRDLDIWFDQKVQHFRRTGNVLIKQQ
jgi:hypothetical protein